MSKGMLFWIIWILAVLGAIGVFAFNVAPIWSTVTLLVLFGLLGWHCFGQPVQ